MTDQRIVIVDDHPGFRSALRRTLEADGWTVVGEAEDGASAIDVVVGLRPDVVLLDIGLRDGDGFGVARRLALLEPAPAVVLISSRDAVTYRDRIDSSPARGFLAKHELDGVRLRVLLGGPA